MSVSAFRKGREEGNYGRKSSPRLVVALICFLLLAPGPGRSDSGCKEPPTDESLLASWEILVALRQLLAFAGR